MNIDGKTKIYGIIGHPVEHTLSPVLHNAVFEKRGVNAVYVPFPVAPDDLPLAIEGFKALTIGGWNITLPHKEQAIHFVDSMPKSIDKGIGAINTLVLVNGKTLGFNTDGLGFLNAIQQDLQFNPKGKTVVILGAGGSARALAFTLLENDVESLYIYNRTHERAQGLEDYLKKFFPEKNIQAFATIEELEKTSLDLLVNCTSCGMKDSDPYPINPDVLEQVSHFYDLIYAPLETKLLKEAKRRKLVTANGIGMLIHQAVVSHRLWFPDAKKEEVFGIMKNAYERWSKV